METGVISTEPENHDLMTRLRQAKVDKIANSIPLQEVEGDPDADLRCWFRWNIRTSF